MDNLRVIGSLKGKFKQEGEIGNYQLRATNSDQICDFKIRQKHENVGIKFLRTYLNTKTPFQQRNICFSNFKQGYIGNCGLIASLAAMSQRSELKIEVNKGATRNVKKKNTDIPIANV